MTNILHAMLGKNLGGLEKVFVDYQPHLQAFASASGGRCLPVVRHGSKTAGILPAGFGAIEIAAFSDWDPISTAAARAATRRHQATAIVCHGQRAYRIFKRASAADIPLIACIHKPRFDVERERTYYFCVAEHLSEAVRAHGVPQERIFTVHNAVAHPHVVARPFQQADRRLTILAAGRLHHKKGYDVLLDALSALNRQGLAFNAVIAGEGEERARLEAQIRRLNLEAIVTLPGWVDDVPAFLSTGDVFVFPSRQEGFPLMLLEAMASGLPVVSAAIPGADEIVEDGKTGRAVQPDNAQELADAIRTVIDHPAASIAMAQAGSAHVRAAYGEERLGTQLAESLGKVLELHHNRRQPRATA